MVEHLPSMGPSHEPENKTTKAIVGKQICKINYRATRKGVQKKRSIG
jgi:hypothetical protein